MTNNNNYPVDMPKTYTTSYFNEAEWDKDLTPEQITKRDELAELIYQDSLLNDPQYGPGANMSTEDVVKKIGSVALATSYFTPLGAITAPMTAVAASAGGAMWAVGKVSGEDDLKGAGKSTVDGLSCGTLNARAPLIAKGVKTTAQVISTYNDVKGSVSGEMPTGNPRTNGAIARYALGI